MDEIQMLRRKLERERLTRLEAEQIAETALADLYEANQVLDTRVQEQTADLQAALDRAEHADAAKDAFLKGMAHRTGSPLHVIQGFIELAVQGLGGGAIRDAANTAAIEARRLSRAFDVLLEMSQAVSGDLDLITMPMDLGPWVERVLDRWLPEVLAQGRLLDLRLETDPAASFRCDEQRLSQVLDALIENALEHGEGSIQVRLDLAGPDDTRDLVMIVSDAGAGIDPGIATTFFDAFVGGDGLGGFGVGLALARMIAEALGGSVDLMADTDTTSFIAVVPVDARSDSPVGTPMEVTSHADVVQLTSATPATVAPADRTGPPPMPAATAVEIDATVLTTLAEEIAVPGFITRLVEVFLDSVARWLPELASDDPMAITRTAHTVVSSARQLGMIGISDLAKQVELHGGQQDIERLQALLREAGAPLRAAVASIDQTPDLPAT